MEQRLDQQTFVRVRQWYLPGLVATGTTEVSEIYHIERGYEDFVGKFKSLGADLMRVEEHDV